MFLVKDISLDFQSYEKRSSSDHYGSHLVYRLPRQPANERSPGS